MNGLFEYDPRVHGVKGLIFIGEKILVYRRDNNTTDHPLEIDLPGGGIEGQETPFEVFQREAKEEFSLELTPKDMVYAISYPAIADNKKLTYFVVAKLSVEARVVFGDEGLSWTLMPVADYLKLEDAWTLFQDKTRDYLAAAAN